MPTKDKRFRIALSFPGEYRNLVENIADMLATTYGREQVLYDKYHTAEFARPNLDTYLQKLYRDESDLIVVFICKDYNEKMWCGIEWRAIRDLLNTQQADDRIMFIKCGKGSVDGVFGTTDGHVDTNEFSTVKITNHIVSRHSSITNTSTPVIKDDVAEPSRAEQLMKESFTELNEYLTLVDKIKNVEIGTEEYQVHEYDGFERFKSFICLEQSFYKLLFLHTISEAQIGMLASFVHEILCAEFNPGMVYLPGTQTTAIRAQNNLRVVDFLRYIEYLRKYQLKPIEAYERKTKDLFIDYMASTRGLYYYLLGIMSSREHGEMEKKFNELTGR